MPKPKTKQTTFLLAKLHPYSNPRVVERKRKGMKKTPPKTLLLRQDQFRIASPSHRHLTCRGRQPAEDPATVSGIDHSIDLPAMQTPFPTKQKQTKQPYFS